MNITFRKLTTLAASITVALLAVTANAMSVSPIVLDMSTTGTGSHEQLAVLNDAASALPVEIVILRLEISENGEMITKPAGDEFMVYPPQAMVKPGGTQNFRIQWVGDPNIPTSQSYVFSVNQVPVRMPKGQSGVQIVFNFATVVNVTPPGGKADINLVNTGVGKDDKGKQHPELTVMNPGNINAKLTDATIRLSSGSWSETLEPDKLRQAMGIGLIQPGKTRRFTLPIDLPNDVKQITASIEYKPRK